MLVRTLAFIVMTAIVLISAPSKAAIREENKECANTGRSVSVRREREEERERERERERTKERERERTKE